MSSPRRVEAALESRNTKTPTTRNQAEGRKRKLIRGRPPRTHHPQLRGREDDPFHKDETLPPLVDALQRELTEGTNGSATRRRGAADRHRRRQGRVGAEEAAARQAPLLVLPPEPASRHLSARLPRVPLSLLFPRRSPILRPVLQQVPRSSSRPLSLTATWLCFSCDLVASLFPRSLPCRGGGLGRRARVRAVSSGARALVSPPLAFALPCLPVRLAAVPCRSLRGLGEQNRGCLDLAPSDPVACSWLL